MCEHAVVSFFCDYRLSPGSVLVAVSGGGDSLALLMILHELRERLGIVRLDVAHVNHGLRGEQSDREEAFVRARAEQIGAAVHVCRLSGPPCRGQGLEQWARKRRYRFFVSLRARHGYDYIATGHTAQDQAETVLMRCCRGAGLRGMRGIAPVREDRVIRPMLALSREDCRHWLRDRGISWCEDASNEDLGFRRNWIRHCVLAPIEQQWTGATRRIARVADESRRAYALVAEKTNKIIDTCVLEKSGERFFLSKRIFDAGDKALVAEALVELCARRGIAIARKRIEEIIARRDRVSGQFLLSGGWRYFPWRAWIEFLRGEPEASPFCFALRAPGETNAADVRLRISLHHAHDNRVVFDNAQRKAFLDAEATGLQLEYRNVRADDRFWPLGASSSHNCIAYLKKQRVGARERSMAGVVARRDGEIVWIPTVAISRPHGIGRDTRRILKISFQAE
jgi:tRNA(Ile)-lysidine synthase